MVFIGAPKFSDRHRSPCGGVPLQHPRLKGLAAAGSCEPDGVGEHRAQPHCGSGDTGDSKKPVRVHLFL